jgi:UDP-2,3-diacylglucosamine pyrophosphatase LpxH
LEREAMPTNQGWGVGGVRTVFISDVHLGHKHSQGLQLIRFLEDLRPQSLYLVGDIIDGWALGSRSGWSEACTDVLRRLSEMADQGTQLYYTPGNHDAFLRDTSGLRFVTERFDFVQIADEFLFEAADGRRFVVTHGDLFDVFETSAQWISVVLSVFYNTCLSANRWLSVLMGRKNKSPYHLCSMGKRIVKRVVRFLSRYERSLSDYARRKNCDGVICGHLHTPKITERDGFVYCNTGDWVEHCTALIEGNDGTLSLLQFYGNVASSVSRPRPTPARRFEREVALPSRRIEPETLVTGDPPSDDQDAWHSTESLVPA